MNDRTNGAAGSGPDKDPTAAEPRAAGTEPGQQSHAKRGGTRAQERIAALDSRAAAGSQLERIEQLEAELAAAQQRAEEAQAGWQRARADFANLKRRSEEERAALSSMAGDRLLIRVLDLADDFDLAIEHVPGEHRHSAWVEGISAIDRKLRQLLEAEGIAAMGGEGEPFDPHTQQAISYEDSADVPDGTVLRVLQRGYTVGERVLRPALVAVARNDDTSDPHIQD